MLGELGVPVEERLYFVDKPTREEVRALAEKLPGGVRDLVAPRSRRLRELGLQDRELTEEAWIDLLVQEPGLWRRPIAVKGGRVVIGFDEKALKELALGSK